MHERAPTKREGKQPRGEAVIAAILKATVRHLAKFGYDALSIDAIANEAGVNKTTVYRRWPTKADLVFASVHAAKADFKAPDTGSIREDLVLLLGSIRDFMVSMEGRCFFKTFLEKAHDPDILRAFRQMREAADNPPKVVVERAIARGELPEGTDQRLMTMAMIGALRHLVLIEAETVDRARIEKIVDLVLYGAARPR